MDLNTFIEFALAGNSVVLKNGVLERVERKGNRRVFSYKRSKNSISPAENVSTILAYIESIGNTYGVREGHLASLLLIDAIRYGELLSASMIMHTYNSVILLSVLLKQYYPLFIRLGIEKQKEYVDLITKDDNTFKEKELVTRSFLLQNAIRKREKYTSQVLDV